MEYGSMMIKAGNDFVIATEYNDIRCINGLLEVYGTEGGVIFSTTDPEAIRSVMENSELSNEYNILKIKSMISELERGYE